jgi:integrase
VDRIDTVEGQKRLEPRKAIYWRRIGVGRHVGARKESGSAPLLWFARHYMPGRKTPQIRRKLGDFADRDASLRFSAAERAARDWFEHVDVGGHGKTLTVIEAAGKYIEHAQEERGKAAPLLDMEGHMRRLVENDPIAALPLDRLTRNAVAEWRKRIIARPIAPPKGKPKAKPRKRAAATINRELGFVGAVLNFARQSGLVTADTWTANLRPLKLVNFALDVADAERAGRKPLDRKQRAALVAALPDDVAALVRCMTLIPLRPGAVAALEAGDFDATKRMLHVRVDKAGADRKIPLPSTATAFLREHAKGKTPRARLFPRADGKRLTKDDWKAPMRDAVRKAKLPRETVLYSVRHGVITDAITAGADVLTVARIAGTSLQMIQKFYGHLVGDRARDALEKLAL